MREVKGRTDAEKTLENRFRKQSDCDVNVFGSGLFEIDGWYEDEENKSASALI